MSNIELNKQEKNKIEYYDAIKTGLKKNKKNIPNLDSSISTLTKLFLKYKIKI